MLVHPNDENIRFNSLIQQPTRKHTKTPSLCDIEPYASHRWSKQCCFCFHWCDHQISEGRKACREKRTVKSNSVKKWTSYDILIQKILVRWRIVPCKLLFLLLFTVCVWHFQFDHILLNVCIFEFCFPTLCFTDAATPSLQLINAPPRWSFQWEKTTQSGDFHDNSMPVGLWNPYNGYI